MSNQPNKNKNNVVGPYSLAEWKTMKMFRESIADMRKRDASGYANAIHAEVSALKELLQRAA